MPKHKETTEETRERHDKYYRNPLNPNPVNNRQRYTDDDIRLIMAKGMTDFEIAEITGRTLKAVEGLRQRVKNNIAEGIDPIMGKHYISEEQLQKQMEDEESCD